MTLILLGRLAVASVWLYEGLVCKLLGPSRHQIDVVAAVPGSIGGRALFVLRGIGALECLLGLWVLCGRFPFAAAGAQTALLVAMNATGLFWARKIIPDPGGMIVKNIAFLVLAWIVAGAS